MIIYKDCFTDGEMFTDSYRHDLAYDDQIIRIKAKRVTRTDDIDDSKFGANASAEEQSEALDDTAVSGINLVLDNRLSETYFDKKSFKADWKKKMESIIKRMQTNGRCEGEITAFKKAMQTFTKDFLLGQFAELQFFVGESADVEAVPCFLKHDDENDGAPYFYFIKEALIEEKA